MVLTIALSLAPECRPRTSGPCRTLNSAAPKHSAASSITARPAMSNVTAITPARIGTVPSAATNKPRRHFAPLAIPQTAAPPTTMTDMSSRHSLPATFVCGDCEQGQPPASASREDSASFPKTSGRRATDQERGSPRSTKNPPRLPLHRPLRSTSAPVTPPRLKLHAPLTGLSLAIQTPKRKVESFRPHSA